MLTANETRALQVAAEDLVFMPTDDEVRQVLVVNPQEDEHYRLTLVKGLMVRLLQTEQRVQQRLVQAVRFIEEHELWKADRDADGRPYRSMTAYLPSLLQELKRQGYTDTVGVRQMRTWLAADRVLVQSGLMDWEQVQEVGIGVVEKVLQATAYDPKTGVIAETVPEGSKKLNRSQAEALLREVMDDRENWTVDQVAKEADERRGVTRKRAHFIWVHDRTGQWVKLQDILVTVGAETQRYHIDVWGTDSWAPDDAEQFMRLINATSNLEELLNED